jgi:cytochrome P450
MCRMGFDWTISLMPFGTFWQDHRRLFHREMNPDAVKRFRPHEQKAVHEFLHHLLDRPEAFVQHIRLFVLSPSVRILCKQT